jgi:hypothetical protein
MHTHTRQLTQHVYCIPPLPHPAQSIDKKYEEAILKNIPLGESALQSWAALAR